MADLRTRGVLVDLAIDSPATGTPTVTIAGPTLAPEELVVRKTLALYSRAEPRDFIDVYVLHQRFDRDETLRRAAEADRGFDPSSSARPCGHTPASTTLTSPTSGSRSPMSAPTALPGPRTSVDAKRRSSYATIRLESGWIAQSSTCRERAAAASGATPSATSYRLLDGKLEKVLDAEPAHGEYDRCREVGKRVRAAPAGLADLVAAPRPGTLFQG